jgi:hypothetical protein
MAKRKDEWEEGEGKNLMGKLPWMKSICIVEQGFATSSCIICH